MSGLSGQCICGAVTYSSSADPITTVTCHCTECQRQSGAAFSVNVLVPLDSFEISGDGMKEYVTTGTDTGKPVRRVFCAECGSTLVSLAEAYPDFAIIKAGSLDDTSVAKPALHQWISSSQDWLDLSADGLPQFERDVTR